MSNKTKVQLETELKEAQAKIAQLKRALKEAQQKPSAQTVATDDPQPEERLRQLLEILPVGISVLDDKRNVVFQNTALSHILDINADGLRLATYKDRKYLSADGSPMSPEGFASVQATRTGEAVYNVETGIVKENGETIWTSVSAMPVDFPDWKIVLVTADITDRKLLEKKLRESEQRYNLLFEKLTVPAIVLKLPEVTIIAVNEASEKLTGFSRKEMVGKTAVELGILKPEQRAQAISQFEKQGAVTDKETRAYTRSGEERIVLSNTNRVTIGEQSYAITTLQDITERKRAEKKLQESQQNLQLFVEFSPAAIAMFDRDMRYIAASRRYIADYHIPTTDIIGRSHYEIFPEMPERWKEIHRQCLAGTSESADAEPFPRADGKMDWVRWEIHPWYESDGRVGGIILFSEVITNRVQLEQEQTKLAERLDLATCSAHMGIWDWDIEKNEIVWDNQMYALHGLTPGEFSVAYDAWLHGLHPEDRVSSNEVTAAAVRGEREYDTEFRVLWPDGTVHWLKANGQVFRDENGTPLRMVGVNYDITERKQMEDALREKERRLREAQRIAHIGNWEWDLRTGETRWSPENYAIHGISQDSPTLTPEMLIKFVHPDDLEMVNAVISQAISSGTSADLEYRVFRPDGSMRVIHAMGEVTEFDVDGRPSLMLGTNQDITERKRIVDELRRSNAELEQFAYIASHDLQEPLRAVAGMVQLLQKRYQGQLDERADEYIGHAVEAAGRMQALIQALLTYSRVERHSQPIEPVGAGTCLQAALRNLDISLRESHAVITTDELPTVHADAVQLIQLFQNLIGNGIKFRGDQEPQVHISATTLKDAWQFSVRDNGIGIEPQYFERIFLIFQRLHTRREYSGTGIGLALCKKIVERHGGHIWVESEPGKGSIFHFTLPMRSQS